jgi:hypothetical protein
MPSSCVPVGAAGAAASMFDQFCGSVDVKEVYAGMTTAAPGHMHGALMVQLKL